MDDADATYEDDDIMPSADDDEAFLGGRAGPSAGPSAGLRARASHPLEHDMIDKPLETTPLIRASSTSRVRGSKFRRSRRSSVGPHGDATVTQAVLMVNHLISILDLKLTILYSQLLKSFIGTGVLFLGKA